MIIELRPEQERMIREHLASGQFHSIEDLLTTALASLPQDRRWDADNRRSAVGRMLQFGERRGLSLGEPVTRQFLHEGHRF